jgi:tRNA A37 threonylcarbamoyladenosine biosynthesis protein TsaE
MPHAHARTVDESQACVSGVASVSREQHNVKVTPPTRRHLSVFHPDMLQIMHLSLYETLQKYCIESDVSEVIASEALTVLEEKVWDVLRGKMLDRTLQKVTELRVGSKTCSEVNVKTEDKAASQIHEMLNDISLPNIAEEWRQKMSHYVEQVNWVRTVEGPVDKATQTVSTGSILFLKSCHTGAIEGHVNKATQTVSTGRVLFLKLLSES